MLVGLFRWIHLASGHRWVLGVVDHRGFGCEIMCPKSFDGLGFDLSFLLQGRMLSLIPLMVDISLIIGRRGFACEDESFGGVIFDIIFCMSRFNHILSRDTLRRDTLSSFLLQVVNNF